MTGTQNLGILWHAHKRDLPETIWRTLDGAVRFALEKMGLDESFHLKTKQYDAMKNIVTLNNDTLVVLPTGLIRQIVNLSMFAAVSPFAARLW